MKNGNSEIYKQVIVFVFLNDVQNNVTNLMNDETYDLFYETSFVQPETTFDIQLCVLIPEQITV